MTASFTNYELLLGQYCQTRDGALYIHLTRDVMPALTMSQEENECAKRYRQLYPAQLTPFAEPRNLRYEEWKRTNCFRWYYFDHEQDAKKTLAMRLERDEECRVSRVPTMRQTFRMDTPMPANVRPTTMRWKGYEPPPLLGYGGERYAPGEQSMLDYWTMWHTLSGVVSGVAQVPWWATLGFAVAWEIAENPLKERYPSLFPDAKRDSYPNAVADIAATMVGYLIGLKLAQPGGDRRRYSSL